MKPDIPEAQGLPKPDVPEAQGLPKPDVPEARGLLAPTEGPGPAMVTLITKKLQSQCLDDLAHKSYDTGLVSCPPRVRGCCPGWVSAWGGDRGGWAAPQGGPGILRAQKAPQGSDGVLASLKHCE